MLPRSRSLLLSSASIFIAKHTHLLLSPLDPTAPHPCSSTLLYPPAPLSVCRAGALLEEAERLWLQLEDRQQAAHCSYLRALMADALGEQAQRDAHAASFVALQRAGD